MSELEKFSYYDPKTGSYIETQFDHLELPDNLVNPVIDDVSRTMNLGITRASGWHYADNAMIFIPAYRKVSGQSLSFKLRFKDKDGNPSKKGIHFEFSSSRSFSKTILLADVFKVAFGISDPDEIRSLVAVNSEYLTSKYLAEKTPEQLLRAIKNSEIVNTIDLTHKLQTLITKQTMLDAPARLYDLLSLQNFKGCSLATDVEIGGTMYSQFTVLDEQLAFDLEHSGLSVVDLLTPDNKTMSVLILGQMYCQLKPRDMTLEEKMQFLELEMSADSFRFKDKVFNKEGVPPFNTLEVYCAIINRLFNFDTADVNFSMQDYKNQKIVTFEDKVRDFINEDLERVYHKISTTDNLLEAVKGHTFDKSRAMKLIKNADSALAVITKNENPIALTSQGNALVRDVKFLAKEAIQVLPQDNGVIDPVDSSESKNIGKVTPLTVTTTIGEDGNLYTPLYKVVNGIKTNEVEVVPVSKLPELFVAECGVKLGGNVLVKHKGVVKLFPSSVVTHVRVSPFSTSSICRGSSVFMENTDQKRTQMTANTQKQTRSILRPQRALVETGVEAIVANGDAGNKHIYTVEDLFKAEGVKTNLEGHRFEIYDVASTGRVKEYRLVSDQDPNLFVLFKIQSEKSSYGSSYEYHIVPPQDGETTYLPNHVVYRQHNIVLSGKVEGSDRLDYHSGGDQNYFQNTVANGLDFFVMFGFCDSYTVDDASVISDVMVRTLKLHTPVVVTKKYKLPKFNRKDIEERHGVVKGKVPKGYTSDGLPLVGSYLNPGADWFYKYETDDSSGSREYNDTTLRLTSTQHGEVISVEKTDEEVIVTLSKWVALEVGDKFSGRHGNKTIVARVMPAELMPFHPETGRRIDMIINPLGIPSRGNISQLGELQAAAEIKEKGLDSRVIPPFSNELWEMVQNYEKGKDLTELQLINPRTGQYYPQKHFCGYMHYLRNAKIAEGQIKMVGDSREVDIAFGQPVGGDLKEKGQAISSMEKEILVSYGAKGVLNEIHSILSADRAGFRKMKKHFEEHPYSESVEARKRNNHSDHMQHAALAFHLTFKQVDGEIQTLYLSDEDMEEFVEINPQQVDYYLTDHEFLKDPMYINMPKMITPVAVRKFKFTSMVGVSVLNHKGSASPAWMGKSHIEGIVNGSLVFSYFYAEPVEGQVSGVPKVWIYPPDIAEEHLEKRGLLGAESYSGMGELIKFLERFPMEMWVDHLEEYVARGRKENDFYPTNNIRRLEDAKVMLEQGGFGRFITTRFPVLPGKYRQTKDALNDKNSFSSGYKDIVRLSRDAGNSKEGYARLYKRMRNLMLPNNDPNSLSLFEFWTKKDKGGRIRSKVLKTRVRCSMRDTIVPMFAGDPKELGYPDFAGHPDSIGLPLVGALTISEPVVMAYIKEKHPDLYDPKRSDIDNLARIVDILSLPLTSIPPLVNWDVSEIPSRVKALKKELTDFVTGRYVFYGRAPSLQETSARGARIYVHEERVVHLNSLLTTDLNADHDGDQIYIVMVFTDEAIEDIKTKMLPSVRALRYNDGMPSLAISQDALLGLYFATQDPTDEGVVPMTSIEQIRIHLKQQMVKPNTAITLTVQGKKVLTTVGRAIINSIIFTDLDSNSVDLNLDETTGFYKLPYEIQISGKGEVGSKGLSISNLQLEIAHAFSSRNAVDTYHKLQQFGYQVAEQRNLTVGIKDLTPALKVESVNKQIKQYVETARSFEELGMLPDDYLMAIDNKVDSLVKSLNIASLIPDDNAFKILTTSGAKGKIDAIVKMFGVTGFVNDNEGKKIPTPILSNTVRGLSQFQVEDLSYTQRDNAISTVFETSKPGETLRSGAFELSGMIVNDDCPEEKEIPQLVVYQRRLVKERDETTGIDKFIVPGKLWLGKNRKSAKEIEEIEDLELNGGELSYDLLRQLRNMNIPWVELDCGNKLYFDVVLHPVAEKYFRDKSDLGGKKVSNYALARMLEELPTYIPLATHINEFSLAYGITQKHAGLLAGQSQFKVGENVGIKSSTALAQPANQLVISKRNMERSGGLDNGIDLFKAAIHNAKFYGNDPKSFDKLAPEDGVVTMIVTNDGTALQLETERGYEYEIFIKAEDEKYYDILVESGDKVTIGQTIYGVKLPEGEERPIHPLLSFTWDIVTIPGELRKDELSGTEFRGAPKTFKASLINPSSDLVQLVRFYIIVYIESIYRSSGITLDPNHFGAFSLQPARHVEVLDYGENLDEQYKNRYLNLHNYFHEVKEGSPDTIVRMVLTGASTTILLTAGPVAAISYRDAMAVASRATTLKALPEYGSMGKVALGMDLAESLDDKVVLRKFKNRNKVETIKFEEQGEELKVEISKEQEQDLFGGGFDWGAASSSPTETSGSNIFGTMTESATSEKTEDKPTSNETPIVDSASGIFGGMFSEPTQPKEEEVTATEDSVESAKTDTTQFGTSSIFGGGSND